MLGLKLSLRMNMEAQRFVWEGAIPLQIHLHESEVTTLPSPPPALVWNISLSLSLLFRILRGGWVCHDLLVDGGAVLSDLSSSPRLPTAVGPPFEALLQHCSSSWCWHYLVRIQGLAFEMVYTNWSSFWSSMCRTRATLESYGNYLSSLFLISLTYMSVWGPVLLNPPGSHIVYNLNLICNYLSN